MHPFSDFIESLRADGFQPTPHDYHRINLALRAGGAWQLNQLRDMLAALLVKTPEQDFLFQRRFEAFFKKSEQSKSPEKNESSPVIPNKSTQPNSKEPEKNKIVSLIKNIKPKKGGFKFFVIFIIVILIVSLLSVGYDFYRPHLSIQPNPLVFGEQILHTNTQQTLYLTNSGLAPLTIHQIILPDTKAFKFTNNCPDTIASGNLCTIEVQFTPTQPIDYTATLTIHNNSTEAHRTVELINLGSTPLTIEKIRLSDSSAFEMVTDHCSQLTLTDEPCTIDIQFTPQQLIDYTATLTIPNRTGNNQISLTGSGVEVAQSQRLYPEVPFIKNITPIPNPAQEDWKTSAIIAALFCLVLLGYVIELWRKHQPPKVTPPVWDSEKPRLFSLGKVGASRSPVYRILSSLN